MIILNVKAIYQNITKPPCTFAQTPFYRGFFNRGFFKTKKENGTSF